jgi:protein subunit release factor B
MLENKEELMVVTLKSEKERIKFKLEDHELKEEFMRGSGPGG